MLRRWSCAGLLLGLLATLMWASTTAMEMPPAPSPSLTRLLFGSAFGAVHGGAVEVKNPVDVVMLPTGDLLVSSFMTNQVRRCADLPRVDEGARRVGSCRRCKVLAGK